MSERSSANALTYSPEAESEVFHRVKRSSSILGFIGVSFGLILSGIFMLIGAVGLQEAEFWFGTVVFGLIGIGVFVICLRGGWSLATAPMIHVLTFEPDQVTWGYAGKEKSLDMAEVESIRWSVDSDGELHLSLRKRGGKRVAFPNIDTLVKPKHRPILLAYLQNRYPSIRLELSNES
jgi:hypothetical protein